MRMRRILATFLLVALVASLTPMVPALAVNNLVWAERVVPGADGEIRAVEFVDEDDGFLLEYESFAHRNRLWVTENGGDTWTERGVFHSGWVIIITPYDYIEIKDIAFGYDGLHGWAVGVSHRFTAGGFPLSDDPYILGTDDGGKTWTNQTPNIDTSLAGEGGLNAVYFTSGSEAYACGESGMFLAGDGWGDDTDDWEVISHNKPSYTYNDVTQGYGNLVRRAVCVGDDGIVGVYDYNWTNQTWATSAETQIAAVGTDLNAVTWPDTDYDQVLTVGTGGFYAYSINDAVTWTPGDTGSQNWMGLDFDDYNIDRAFAVGDNGDAIGFDLNDAEDTWSTYSIGNTGVLDDLYDVACVGSYGLWAAGDNGTVTQRDPNKTSRKAGTNRYTTALEMSANWPDDSCDTVVMATGLDFPDALSASGLAGAYESPLLLIGASPRTDVSDEIDRLGADTVVVVGGTGAVSQSIQDWLEDDVNVTVDRIEGSNRYDTSAQVATRIKTVRGSDFFHVAFVARGDSYADALAVSPFAYSKKMPVLLTKSNSLPADTADALDNLAIHDVIVAGGEAAVSNPVVAEINAIVVDLNSGDPSERWSGDDRYQTAETIARNGISHGWGSSAYVGLATGTNFPDALGGGPVCGAAGGVMLLTKGTALSSAADDFITDYHNDIIEIEVFGGTAVVTDAVKSEAEGLLW